MILLLALKGNQPGQTKKNRRLIVSLWSNLLWKRGRKKEKEKERKARESKPKTLQYSIKTLEILN